MRCQNNKSKLSTIQITKPNSRSNPLLFIFENRLRLVQKVPQLSSTFNTDCFDPVHGYTLHDNCFAGVSGYPCGASRAAISAFSAVLQGGTGIELPAARLLTTEWVRCTSMLAGLSGLCGAVITAPSSVMQKTCHLWRLYGAGLRRCWLEESGSLFAWQRGSLSYLIGYVDGVFFLLSEARVLGQIPDSRVASCIGNCS